MTSLSPEADRMVRSYLDDLGRMLEPADPAERAEILDQVREHIEAALTSDNAGSTDVERVREVLAGLGSPGSIAAGSLGPSGATSPVPAPEAAKPGFLAKPWLPWLIVGLMAGLAVPYLGWVAAFIGFVLFLASPLWTGREKILGALCYLAPVLAVFLIATVAFLRYSGESTTTTTTTGDIFLPASYDLGYTVGLALWILAPLWCASVALVLARAAGKRRGHDPRRE